MTAATAGSATPTVAYRDDGPVASLVGFVGLVRFVDRSWRRRSFALTVTVLGVAGLGAATGLEAVGVAGGWSAVAGALWCVLVAGTVAGHRHSGGLDWLAPPLLRAGEYAFVATLGLVYGAPPALVFALLAAMAYHHYDTAYRPRQRGRPLRWPASWPGPWLDRAGLGWDGRTLVAGLAAATGAATVVYAVLTVALWMLFVVETAGAWGAFSVGRGRDADLPGRW